MFGKPLLFAGTSDPGAGSYNIGRSLRFDGVNDYLLRTVNVTNPTKKSISLWVKKTADSAVVGKQDIINTYVGGGEEGIYFANSGGNVNNIVVTCCGGGSSLITSARFRDPSSWYHLFFRLDTTQAISSDRVKLWINGSLAALDSSSYPSQNVTTDQMFSKNTQIGYGMFSGTRGFFHGYISELHYVEGLALLPTDFGYKNEITGQWLPKSYSGSYGTTGFYLPFSDGTGVTPAYLGKDASGTNIISGQTCTTNGTTSVTAITGTTQPQVDQIVTGGHFAAGTYITAVGGSSGAWTCTLSTAATGSGSSQSVTFTGNNFTFSGMTRSAGVDDCWTSDTPTNNFATWNALKAGSGTTLSAGNLSVVTTAGSRPVAVSTIAMRTGKWYMEVPVQTGMNSATIGVVKESAQVSEDSWTGSDSYSYEVDTVTPDSFKKTAASTRSSLTGAPPALPYVLGLLFDADAGTLEFYENNSSVGSITGLTTGVDWYWMCGDNSGATAVTTAITGCFGQATLHASATYDSSSGGYFRYTPPSGAKALCSQNLPQPVIHNPKLHFDVKTYTGNGANLQVGEVAKAQDLVVIDKSLRFRNENSAYLTRTPGSAATDSSLWTVSFWYKRSTLGSLQRLLASSPNSGTNLTEMSFQSNNTLYCQIATSTGPASRYIQTTQVFRNTATPDHYVLAYDRDHATAAYRLRLYVNGLEITDFSTDQRSSIAGTDDCGWNVQSIAQYIGRAWSAADYSGGYFSDFYNIDGQALLPSDFAQTDGNGYWVPKAYAGTYGTNGFHLEFEEIATTSGSNAGLGKDTSGNTNYWNTNGISVTEGPDYDSMVDTPTNSYCVLDPIQNNKAPSVSSTIEDGGLYWINTAGANAGGCPATTLIRRNTGKYYWEIYLNALGSEPTIGLAREGINWASIYSSSGANGAGTYNWTVDSIGYYHDNGASPWPSVSSVGAAAATDIMRVAYDSSNGYLWFGKNTTWNGGSDPGAGTGPHLILPVGNYYPYVLGYSNAAFTLNFGQRPFTTDTNTNFDATAGGYFHETVPTGFKALSENNIQEYLYDVEKPDVVWIKNRTTANHPYYFDSLRGPGKRVYPDANNVEATDVNSLIAFNKNGFYIGNNTDINTLNNNYLALLFKMAGGGSYTWNFDGDINRTVTMTIASPCVVSLTDNNFENGQAIKFTTTGALPTGLVAGTIYYVVNKATHSFEVSATVGGASINTSGSQSGSHTCVHGVQTSVNSLAGMSVMSWVGSAKGATQTITVGHGLGGTPGFAVVKSRGLGASARSWITKTNGLADSKMFYMDDGTTTPSTNDLTSSSDGGILSWSSTLLSVKGGSINSNAVDDAVGKMMGLAFREVTGFSKLGTYVGNGSSDGPFVWCGFEPRFLFVRALTAAGNFVMYDTGNKSYNGAGSEMYVDTSDYESVGGNRFDILSNGFKNRNTGSAANSNGVTYFFMAFAETPFKYSNAR